MQSNHKGFLVLVILCLIFPNFASIWGTKKEEEKYEEKYCQIESSYSSYEHGGLKVITGRYVSACYIGLRSTSDAKKCTSKFDINNQSEIESECIELKCIQIIECKEKTSDKYNHKDDDYISKRRII